MLDADPYAWLDRLVLTPEDAHGVTRVIAELAKVAALPDAQAIVAEWATDSARPLRKAIAAHWLERATQIVAAGRQAAGDLGERAGRAIEPHTHSGKNVRGVALGIARSKTGSARSMERKAGAAAASVMSPETFPPRGTEADDAAFRAARQANSDKGGIAAAASRRAHIDARSAAYAKFGRVTAHHAYHVGLIAGAAGAAAGTAHGATALSEKQHQERVAAARARWGSRSSQTQGAAQ